ncbi:MAG: aminoacyl-tRNA hydrolase [Candidatus Tantalella remota]|nr:aminoacyl-tRNA hydrolase [Candidatus Tantalella remota]
MKIIVGLGNPGFRYRNTRHNAGFLALKLLAADAGISIRKKGYSGIYGIGRIEGQEVLLFEPLTYMNRSGEAVKSICSAKLDESSELLVVTDDFNIPLGSVRLREQGSAGGHNGLKSIIEHIGNDFTRLRLGVGTVSGIEDMSSYVLSAFPRRERACLNGMLEESAGCIKIWLSRGIKEAMNRHN